MLAFSLAQGVEPIKPVDPAATSWPGITASVYQMVRLPGDRVAVKFIYQASADAPAETYVADRPIKSFYPDSLNASPVEYSAYRIADKGKLIDEATGKTFLVAESKAEDAVQPGQTEILRLVQPKEGFFLDAVFNCPAVDVTDPPKEQRVSFALPGLKEAIRRVRLPREENVPLDFFPPPKLYRPPIVK